MSAGSNGLVVDVPAAAYGRVLAGAHPHEPPAAACGDDGVVAVRCERLVGDGDGDEHDVVLLAVRVVHLERVVLREWKLPHDVVAARAPAVRLITVLSPLHDEVAGVPALRRRRHGH
jgi:hypothetical protein